MPRRKRLYHHVAGLDAAPGPARHLGQKLEGALGCAEIGNAQRRIRGQDPGKGHVREIEPLGYHLGPDENVGPAGAEIGQYLLVRALARRDVEVHPGDAGSGKEPAGHLLHALGPDAAPVQMPRAALGACGRHRAPRAADVAAQDAVGAVQRHSDRTVFARLHVPALFARNDRREAAAVQQEHRLLAVAQSVAHRRNQSFGEDRNRSAAAQRLFAHVNDGDARHLHVERAPGHLAKGVFPGFRVVPALERRRGGPEQDRALLQPPAHHGDVAGVVSRRFVLFVALLVLFVNHYEAQIAYRREKSRPGADHHPRLP